MKYRADRQSGFRWEVIGPILAAVFIAGFALGALIF